jgi:hypothetical protein
MPFGVMMIRAPMIQTSVRDFPKANRFASIQTSERRYKQAGDHSTNQHRHKQQRLERAEAPCLEQVNWQPDHKEKHQQ